MIEKHGFYIKDMKMGVLVSYDQINDGFLDPDTQKHPYFPMIIKKNALFLIIFAKKFGSLKIMRTFAIPINKSGGGEMVDTLL